MGRFVFLVSSHSLSFSPRFLTPCSLEPTDLGDRSPVWDRPSQSKMSGFEKNGSSDVAYQLEGLDPREKAERIAASFVPPTPEEERKVIQKLDRRLLPLVFVLYSLAVLDRSNLGNARLAGLTKSIDLSGNRCTYHCCC